MVHVARTAITFVTKVNCMIAVNIDVQRVLQADSVQGVIMEHLLK